MIRENMLRRTNGEKFFYQWDTERKLIVNCRGCTEVHFINGDMEEALCCEIYDLDGIRVVNVPNVLLQVAKPFRTLLNVIDSDGRLTTYSFVFRVRYRPKPEDYIYTETEILSYKDIDERMRLIEEGLGDKVAEEVESYLAENPPPGGVYFETDETLSLKDGVLSVNTADVAEKDNTLPITSAAVHTQIGNIEVLLRTI